jgi:hypothetical protein
MRTIVIRLPPAADLLSEMAEMRGWLDANGCAPSRFKYDLAAESVIIQVEFGDEWEAEVFKRHFGGRESHFVNSERPRALETMERACWWRLMAEEIRAEADEFGSESAKETMALVALSYDRMAEDLEKRLTHPRYGGHFLAAASPP